MNDRCLYVMSSLKFLAVFIFKSRLILQRVNAFINVLILQPHQQQIPCQLSAREVCKIPATKHLGPYA